MDCEGADEDGAKGVEGGRKGGSGRVYAANEGIIIVMRGNGGRGQGRRDGGDTEEALKNCDSMARKQGAVVRGGEGVYSEAEEGGQRQ